MAGEDILGTARTILVQVVVEANRAAEALATLVELNPATLDSPAFVGTPTAPTPSANDNSTKLATTAYLDAKLGVANGIPTLDSSGYVPTSQLPPSVLGGVTFKGLWNASTNSPTITSGVGTTGDFYVVEVAGTTNIDGISSWAVGDWIIFTGSVWEKVPVIQTPETGILLTQLQDISDDRILGNNIGGDGPPIQLTGAQVQAMLDLSAYATLASPAFTGTPTSTTPGTGDDTTKIATTAYVQGELTGITDGFAPLDSPAFTGTPTTPQAAVDDTSSKIASTSFVIGQAGSTTPLMDGTGAVGTSKRYSRQDHRHPSDTSRAPLASPAFTGTPTAPTPSQGDDTTKLATTAYVQTELGLLSGPASPFTTGDVKLTLKNTADTGWVMMDDGTIGSAASGASTRANADCYDLFVLLWNNISNSWCPVSGGRGASAGADWGADKTITLPRTLGRALSIAGAGSGLTSRALGEYLGQETKQLSTDEMPPHTHDLTVLISSGGQYQQTQGDPNSSFSSQQTSEEGGGNSFEIMQPASFFKVMVKL